MSVSINIGLLPSELLKPNLTYSKW